MTAPISLDHPTPVQQSLVKFTHRANQLNIYVDELKPQLGILIDKIIDELEKEKKQSRKFLPIFDQDKFLQFIQNNLDEFNLAYRGETDYDFHATDNLNAIDKHN